MTAIAYLAGPDVFLPNAVAHAATKVEICRRLGLRGLPPLNEDVETVATELARALRRTSEACAKRFVKPVCLQT